MYFTKEAADDDALPQNYLLHSHALEKIFVQYTKKYFKGTMRNVKKIS